METMFARTAEITSELAEQFVAFHLALIERMLVLRLHNLHMEFKPESSVSLAEHRELLIPVGERLGAISEFLRGSSSNLLPVLSDLERECHDLVQAADTAEGGPSGWMRETGPDSLSHMRSKIQLLLQSL